MLVHVQCTTLAANDNAKGINTNKYENFSQQRHEKSLYYLHNIECIYHGHKITYIVVKIVPHIVDVHIIVINR